MIAVRERPPLRLHVTAESPDGSVYRRWGGDEPDGAYIPQGLRFSSTMPGGFESCDCQLRRRPGTDWPDLERLSTLRVLGAGGDIAWEGRLERAPAATGDTLSISPSAVGWQASLEDNKTATMLYRDIDLSHWRGMSVQRKANMLTVRTINDATTEPSTTGAPALKLAVTGAWSRDISCEGVYDAKATRVRQVWYAWQRGDTIIPTDTHWTWWLVGDDDDLYTIGEFEASPNLRAPGPGSGTWQPSRPRRFISAELVYATAAGNDSVEYPVWFDTLAMYGDHTLPKRGTEPNAGFYASDIVRDVVTRFTDLTPEVTDSSFIVPQAAFLDPTTPAEMIKQASRFDLADWGAWEHKTFRWDPTRTPRRNWRTRTKPAQLQETGPQIDRIWNQITVQFNDTDGSSRTVGPPGSGADTETPALRDDDPLNPANRAGIIRHDLLQMGTSTVAGATKVGEMFLAESKLLDHSGQAVANGHIEDDHGILHPAWRMRASDTLSVIDASDPSPRRIVKADYNDDNKGCSVDLDAPPDSMAALLERLGAVLVPLGFS